MAIPKISIELEADTTGAARSLADITKSLQKMDAATEQYEKDLRDLDRAQKSGLLTQQKYEQSLKDIEKEYKDAAKAAALLSGANIKVGKNMNAAAKDAQDVSENVEKMSYGMRNASMQLSQVAQQTMASGNFLQALAIQLPDLTLGFGVMGIAAGVAGGVLLSTLAPALSGVNRETEELEDSLDDLRTAFNGVEQAQRAIADLQGRYADAISQGNAKIVGMLEDELRVRRVLLDLEQTELRIAQRQMRLKIDAQEDEVDLIHQIVEARASMLDPLMSDERRRAEILKITHEEVAANQGLFNELKRNKAEMELFALQTEMAKDGVDKITEALENSAIAARDLREGFGVTVGTMLSGPIMPPSITGLGGDDDDLSGGGGGDPLAKLKNDLKRIEEGFLSQEELAIAHYERDQMILDDALANRLLSEEQYRVNTESLEKEHLDRMEALRRASQMNTLNGWAGMFGDISSLMQTENKKMFQIGKAAAMAEATIKGYQAVINSYEAGTKIGGPAVGAAFAAAAAAKTAVMISNIAKTQFNGGGGRPSAGGGGGATQTQQNQPHQFFVSGVNPDDLFTGRQVRWMFEQMQDAAGDSGIETIWA